MSLHEFLREGQDAPQRILSRLTQLLYNLSATVLQGVPFSPFTTFSRKNSWRDWNDEIMQQESSPLCAADISLDLRKQFAFLSGGRGQNGSPIIIFPEYPAFGELEEQEFHNVLTYLTSVPSLGSTGVGFILVIDRRQDRWASVKGTLLRIAGSFPGNLQLVLVLRPTALFQRTISDIFFKLNKDEFKMKVPVIMLSSVTELHSYIDRTQLTQELGGTQEYCHEKWISHRTAIEGFALMVKKTAQTLQSFGTELAETELPNDVEATSNLLTIHTEKKDTMKEDLRIALCQGSRLLESINEPLVKDPDYTMNHDELENLATVQRLLGQLDETETAFDDFWDKHQTKLEQCLQLRHFEENFREVRAHLDMVYDRVSGFSEVGISPAHVEHILKELTNHEDGACEVLDRALALACDADQLIEASHYAVDSILPKCSELRAVCEEISGVLEAKKTHLLKAMELHQCLEKATKWCDDGIYLLAAQPVDKCQSQDGAESALQDIERYLETANQHKLTDLSGIWRDYESVLTQDFKEQVGKVFQKQLSMQEMFEKRRVSLKKLAAKQTRPVQPVAPRPEAIIIPPISSPAHREKTIEGDIINGNCRKVGISSLGSALLNDEANFPSVIWVSRSERVYFQASTPEIKTAWVNEIRKVLTGQLKAYREASQQKSSDQLTPTSTSLTLSPFKTNPKTLKKGEEKKTEPTAADSSTATLLKNNDKVKDENVTSPTTERAAVAKKRFTLQGFSNLKSQKELIAPFGGKSLTLPMVTLCPPGSSPPSPDHKTKRHEIKSDPTPFGFRDTGPHITLTRVRWLSASSLLQTKRRGFSKASLSVDASEENDGYSSAEDPMNSDPEDEGERKLSPGRYVVIADHDKSGPQELTVKSGDTVQLVREGDDGRWFVRNLRTNKEGWVPAANLLTLIGESKSSQSLSSSEGSGSGNLSTSSSCSETYTSFSDIKA
ncbi:guanine nucleotide exchange factor DBS-like [Sinocyclocheilus grahami]|uniref:guanine nucleotide exchange factor DBS-like n=1 Tax=Sinocyclocheilus grahami TaxID=75366 RepID=UPI0007AD5D0C|nr:PREDICTED: guanine nucleotide exchange factor DBS-like [Sinocyclocheilus grahami]